MPRPRPRERHAQRHRETESQAQREPEAQREGDKTAIPRKICKERGNGEADVHNETQRPWTETKRGAQVGGRAETQTPPGRARKTQTRIQSQTETETGSQTDTNRQIPRDADWLRHPQKCGDKNAWGDVQSENHRDAESSRESLEQTQRAPPPPPPRKSQK